MSQHRSGPWSVAEDAAIVGTYFAMLERELRGERFVKVEYNRRLAKLLNGRSAQAIEFKHANISAILRETGFPFIDGYKPRSNYQEDLRGEVARRLPQETALLALAATATGAPVNAAPSVRALSDIEVRVPTKKLNSDRTYERVAPPIVPLLGVNYFEREANNASLGSAGETFVLEFEHRRLWESGARHLAERVEHVSHTRGDGLGYDIASFDPDGSERLIEVKTTAFGAYTPFFASRHEVNVSDERAEHYRLYRVFKFRTRAQLFVLTGSLRRACVLDPVQYRATIG